MSTETATHRTAPLIAANLVGLGVLAAFNPLLRYSANPVMEWLLSLAASSIFAALLYGLYALVFRQRARDGWPKSYLMLLWFILGSSVVMPYLDKPPVQAETKPQAKVEKHRSQLDIAFENAPPYKPPAK